MERRLDLMPDLGFEDEPVEKVKIAVTTFAFKNADIINLMKERGTVIKKERWGEMDLIEEKINACKDANLLDMTTPCYVFMTFENEEGFNRALNFDEAIKKDSKLEPL